VDRLPAGIRDILKNLEELPFENQREELKKYPVEILES